MPETRDYQDWHKTYDDPGSTLSWRLTQVRAAIAGFLDETAGPVRVLSLCAGDARDLLGVLESRDDAARVSGALVELDPALAAAARERATAGGFALDVVTGDAGAVDTFAHAIPADLVLLVGIFGNIGEEDIRRTISAARSFCAPGARVLWTRGRALEGADDPTDRIRRWFADDGFSELDFLSLDRGSRPSLGVERYDGETQPVPTEPIFTFIR